MNNTHAGGNGVVNNPIQQNPGNPHMMGAGQQQQMSQAYAQQQQQRMMAQSQFGQQQPGMMPGQQPQPQQAKAAQLNPQQRFQMQQRQMLQQRQAMAAQQQQMAALNMGPQSQTQMQSQGSPPAPHPGQQPYMNNLTPAMAQQGFNQAPQVMMGQPGPQQQGPQRLQQGQGQQPTPQTMGPQAGPQFQGRAPQTANRPLQQATPQMTPQMLPGQYQQMGMRTNLVSTAAVATPPTGQAARPPDQQSQNEMTVKIFKRNLGNAGVVRILDLIEQILSENPEKLRQVEYWQRVAQVFLLPTTSLRITTTTPPGLRPGSTTNSPQLGSAMLLNAGRKPGEPQVYELNATTVPRFFAAAMSPLVGQFLITLPGLKFQVFNLGAVLITSQVVMTYQYVDGLLARVTGKLKLLMTRDFRIDWADVLCQQYQPLVLLALLDHQAKMFDLALAQELIAQLTQRCHAVKHAGNMGINDLAMQVMQISDVMGHLRLLMQFLMVNNVALPLKALEMYIGANNHQAAVAAQQQQRQASGSKRGSVLSPSPLTPYAEDPKQVALKKRKLSSVGSPLK